MAKKSDHLFEAQRLYVTQGRTFEEIAQILPVTDRTLREWAKEFGWKDKRQHYLAEQYSFHEDLQRYAKKLTDSIMSDMENNVEVSQSRIRFLNVLLAKLPSVKTYEDSMKKTAQPEEKQEFDPTELINIMRKEVLGL